MRSLDGRLRSFCRRYTELSMHHLCVWLQESPRVGPCGTTNQCIASLILAFHSGDDPRLFTSMLLDNVATARQLTDFFATFGLLSQLALAADEPDAVRGTACVELSKWYALELPTPCKRLMTGTPREQEYRTVAGNLRDSLRRGGLAWVQRRIGTDDQKQLKRYLEFLSELPDDPATNELASNVLHRLQ